MKDAWEYIFGSKSHMNIAGKIFIGIPMLPFIIVFVFTWLMLDFLLSIFSKKSS